METNQEQVKQDEKLPEKLPGYIFPDVLAKVMSKVDVRTQLEASMLSLVLMMFGLVLTIVYLIIYFDFPLWYKILLGVNGLAGLIFMWSSIITNYQQYVNVMEVMKFQKEMKGGNE